MYKRLLVENSPSARFKKFHSADQQVSKKKDIARHFEIIAKDYDKFKSMNWYYHETIKNFLKSSIPPGKKVLELGSGTGDILAGLSPTVGLGIDISKEMVALSKKKYPKLHFAQGTVENFRLKQKFDFVVMVDVIEHLYNHKQAFTNLKKQIGKTPFIMTMDNPAWETIMMISEKLGLKMPEGDHVRLSRKDVVRLYQETGFILYETGNLLILPKFVPGISPFVNRTYHTVPFVKTWGLIDYFKST